MMAFDFSRAVFRVHVDDSARSGLHHRNSYDLSAAEPAYEVDLSRDVKLIENLSGLWIIDQALHQLYRVDGSFHRLRRFPVVVEHYGADCKDNDERTDKEPEIEVQIPDP